MGEGGKPDPLEAPELVLTEQDSLPPVAREVLPSGQLADQPVADDHISLARKPSAGARASAAAASHVPPPPPAMPARFEDPAGLRPSFTNTFIKTLMPGVRLLLAVPASLLPLKWRRHWGLHILPINLGAIVSVVVEALLVMVIAGWAYQHYVDTAGAEALRNIGKFFVKHGSDNMNAPLMGYGFSMYMGFMIGTPQGWICLYFFVEAIGRGVATAIGDPPGTLPLWLIEQARAGIFWLVRAVREGPLVIDHVVTGPGGTPTRIETCRHRGWNTQTTISYDERMYAVTGHERHVDGPRRHHYALAPIEDSRVIRQLVHYTPDAVLPAHRRKRAREQAEIARRRF